MARNILLYHGLREGKKHVVVAAEGTMFEPGELDASIYDRHPEDKDLKAFSKLLDRPELDKDREIEH